MTIPLAFESVSPHSSTLAAGTSRHPSAAATARVRERIRRELVGGGDGLWRMTTKPWARTRRGIARLPQASMRHVVEASITVTSMLGMVFLAIACLAA